MATYAAVVSLMNTMDTLMSDPRLSICFHKQQIQYLGQNLDVLLQFIESYDYNSLGRDEEAQSLERRITSAAHTAEDVIESHIVAQINAGVLQDAQTSCINIEDIKEKVVKVAEKMGSNDQKPKISPQPRQTGKVKMMVAQINAGVFESVPDNASPTSCIDLYQIMHDIEEIKEEVVKVAEKMGNNDQKPKISPQPRQTAGKITMIGFDDYLLQLLDGLTGSKSGRQVIPIVGMGGAGKTTLTKNAYEHSLTVHHFDDRAWVSISQQYDVKDILVQLLSSLGQSPDKNKELGELSECLYKYLYGRRYLVVLDDMWSITAWDKIKSCFPEGSDGSRIIVTTRLSEVANAFGSSSAVRVGLLDDDKSWDLFCDKAFAQQSCPDELEQIGKEIVKKCKGLPLSIVVIGALLGKSSHAREHWENIAENMSSILSSSDDSLDILCLSYNHLPTHLKPCFLYLGVFDEDDEVSVSELIMRWIAEGFIKPNKDQMLEEVAEGYMYDLLERSLILVDSLEWNKKFSRFCIHDLVRELCLREAHKEKLFLVISTVADEVKAERCIVYNSQEYWRRQMDCPYQYLRSVICNTYLPVLKGSTLLRVYAANSARSNEVDEFLDYLQNVNMRFISCEIEGKGVATELPRSIFHLWNLQTLIVRNHSIEFEAPVEIWKMRQLRHVEFWFISLPEPPLSEEEDVHNLQTLTQVVDLRCSDEVCKRIPNIKRLGVHYKDFSKNSNEYCLQNVGRLTKLESLSFGFREEPDHGDLLRNLTLPTSLKNLTLFHSNLDWNNDLGIIGSLPNLELLEITHYTLDTIREWKCVEGQFLALKHLIIETCDINRWIVESCHFPVLDTLTLIFVSLYSGIPLGIGEISTLRVIHVISDDSTLPISAMRVLKEQEDMGNDLLQLQLKIYNKKEVEKFFKEVEKEGIECTNFTCV